MPSNRQRLTHSPSMCGQSTLGRVGSQSQGFQRQSNVLRSCARRSVADAHINALKPPCHIVRCKRKYACPTRDGEALWRETFAHLLAEPPSLSEVPASSVHFAHTSSLPSSSDYACAIRPPNKMCRRRRAAMLFALLIGGCFFRSREGQ